MILEFSFFFHQFFTSLFSLRHKRVCHDAAQFSLSFDLFSWTDDAAEVGYFSFGYKMFDNKVSRNWKDEISWELWMGSMSRVFEVDRREREKRHGRISIKVFRNALKIIQFPNEFYARCLTASSRQFGIFCWNSNFPSYKNYDERERRKGLGKLLIFVVAERGNIKNKKSFKSTLEFPQIKTSNSERGWAVLAFWRWLWTRQQRKRQVWVLEWA